MTASLTVVVPKVLPSPAIILAMNNSLPLQEVEVLPKTNAFKCHRINHHPIKGSSHQTPSTTTGSVAQVVGLEMDH